MRIESEKVDAFIIYGADKLDPISVSLRGNDDGSGSITIECYGMAWTKYWGAMGSGNVADFVRKADTDYVTTKLRRSDEQKRHEGYLRRIVVAVQAALNERATAPTPTPVRPEAETIERLLRHAAEVMHAERSGDSDFANCSFRSLPDDLQQDIERRAEAIDLTESGKVND